MVVINLMLYMVFQCCSRWLFVAGRQTFCLIPLLSLQKIALNNDILRSIPCIHVFLYQSCTTMFLGRCNLKSWPKPKLWVNVMIIYLFKFFFSQAPYNSYRYRLGVNQMPWPNVLNIVQLNFMKIIITCLCMFFYWSVQLYQSFPLCGIPNPFSLSAHTFFLSLWAYVVLFTFHCYELKLDFRLFWFGGCFNLGLDEIWSYKF